MTGKRASEPGNAELRRQVKGWIEFLEHAGCPGLPVALKTLDSEPLPETPDERETLDAIRGHLGDCQRCGLAGGRNRIVFGSGNPSADLMFVGEAPGRDEDLQGLPFVGRAGQLLTRIIEAIGLRREDVYIANILKCRPPGNRDPEPPEVQACSPFLFRQIEAIQPRVVVALGAYAARTLLDTDLAISKLRGRFHEYRGRLLMPTYHPSYLLRNPGAKRPVWEDMQMVRDLLNEGRSADEG
jgi:DNA polymerase